MSFSLIQEGVGQKAAIVAAKAGYGHRDRIELDFIVAQPRIPNYFPRVEAKDPTLKDDFVDTTAPAPAPIFVQV